MVFKEFLKRVTFLRIGATALAFNKYAIFSAIIDLPKANVMCPNTNNLLADFVRKLRLQRYAPASIKTYKNALAKFLTAFDRYNLAQLKVQQIQYFIYQLQEKHAISAAYQKQILASIAKFYLLYYERKIGRQSIYQK